MAVHYQEGQYLAVVKQQGFQESSNGNPMIVLVVKPYVQFIYPNGVEEEDNIQDGYERTIRLVVTDNTKDFVLDKLRAAGFDGSSFRELELQGKSVRCRCSHDVNGDKEYESWDLVFTRESKPVEPLDSAAARKLDAMFGSALKKTPKPIDTSNMKPSHAAAVAAQAPLGTEDEVPF